MDSGRMLSTVLVVLVLSLVAVIGITFAQQPPRQGQGPVPAPGLGPGAIGPVFFPAAPVALWVANGKVFLASAGRLYRFNAETFEKEMEITYQQPPVPAVPQGPPGPAGQRPMPPAP